MFKRLTAPSSRIIDVLATDPGRWLHGYPIMKQAGVGAGTLYPALERLALQGIVERRTTAEGREEYHITGLGQRVHSDLIKSRQGRWRADHRLAFFPSGGVR